MCKEIQVSGTNLLLLIWFCWNISHELSLILFLQSALLGYSKDFKCGDSFLVKDDSFAATFKLIKNGILLYGAMMFPKLFSALIPQPGEGPDRKTMEEGFLKVHGFGKMVSASTAGSGSSEPDSIEEKTIKAKFQLNKDTGYLYTAVLLVETGILLVNKSSNSGETLKSGVLTPASALGSDLTQHILKEMDTSFEIEEINDGMETQ